MSLNSESNDEDERDPLMVQSVVKAFHILSAFDADRSPLSLTQMSRQLGYDKSTIQRFAHTLQKIGYLHKDPETKQYEISVKVLELGHHYIRSNALVNRAMPALMNLHRQSQETVNLTILDETDIVFVARLTSPHMADTRVIMGSRIAAFCTAPGRAILSRLPRERALAVLEASDRRPFTPTTTWKIPDLVAKLDRAAELGYATAFEELFAGDLSIAAPVQNNRGQCLGAVNISLSRSRYEPQQLEGQFMSMLVTAAHAISGLAGFGGGSSPRIEV